MHYSAFMSANPTVLCAISHGLYEPWISILRDGQEKTWLLDSRPQGFDLIHFHGTPLNTLGVRLDAWHERVRWSTRPKAQLLKLFDYVLTVPFMKYRANYSDSELLSAKDPAIHIHFLDSYLTYRWKELSLFRYFIEETDSQYLFITSSSSYVRISKLMEYLSRLPIHGVYAGASPYEHAEFISGSNRILSRDVVKTVLENSRLFNPTIIEDVALGNLIERLGFPRISFPITNIASIDELQSITTKTLDDSYHFRLKSGSLQNRGDVEIMHQLHTKIKEMSNQ